MCLHIIEFKVEKGQLPSDFGSGWKVIIPYPNAFAGPFFNHQFPFDTWVEAKQESILAYYYSSYTTGFHIFETCKAAQIYLDSLRHPIGPQVPLYLGSKIIVVPVEWQGLLARGKTIVDSDDPQTLDAHLTTLVVAKMKIEKPT